MNKTNSSTTVELNKKGTLTARWRKVLLLICGAVSSILLLLLVLTGYYLGWWGGVYGLHGYDKRIYNVNAIASEQLSIHFLQTYGGNGDCIYIKVGDTDVLIDAGPSLEGAASVAQYLDRYCTDGVLEYVVATHGDADHLAGFVGTTVVKGIFSRYDCRTIIQFSQTHAVGDVFLAYCKARDDEIAKGASCYTALQCCNEQNGAQKVYDLGSGVTMEVLYQDYYEKLTAEENDCSVCIAIRQNENCYLFTGDLAEAGETSLLANNPTLGQVTLYKGGHHGSSTSGSLPLLDAIKPQYVCVCCIAGSVEYTQNALSTFPTQEFINRAARYTDNVFVTGCADVVMDGNNGRYMDTGYHALNGDVVFTCTDGRISMYFSADDSKLKDTEWFKTNRILPEQWSTL